MKTKVVLTALVLLCLPQLTNAQGNLVVNGDFGTDASAWTITNVGGGGGYLSSFGDPPGSVLLYNPSLPGVPAASQEISGLTPGGVYAISGNYQNGGGKDFTDNSFGVALDGIFLFEAPTPADFNWHSFNFDYTATSTSALLSFSAQLNGTDGADFIDDIAMYATPEPSATSVILLGGGLLLYIHKRHRHAA